MNTTEDTMEAVRKSFSGKLLTSSQLKKTLAIADILNTEIHRSGSFIETLTDYGHAFARTEKFDAARSEKILRDIYQAKYGMTLNQTRQALVEREDGILDTEDAPKILRAAESIEPLIAHGDTLPFFKAYDVAAVALSQTLGITQAGAKEAMKNIYRAAHGEELYDAGKLAEERHHKPVRQAEIAARKEEQLRSRKHTQSYS